MHRDSWTCTLSLNYATWLGLCGIRKPPAECNRRLYALVYALYAPRFMREKLLQTERAISGLLPNGEKEYHMLFGRISAYRPQLILFILFWVLTFFSFSSDPFRFLLDNISYSSVLSLGISSTLWTYYTASRGIHKMGTVSLNLRPYFTDALLGLRPIGSLALYLAGAYFAALSL